MLNSILGLHHPNSIRIHPFFTKRTSNDSHSSGRAFWRTFQCLTITETKLLEVRQSKGNFNIASDYHVDAFQSRNPCECN